MSKYRWTIQGQPFNPRGFVMCGDDVVAEIPYLDRNERQFIRRLAEVVRAMERVDRALAKEEARGY